jgi:hypothetical protein
MRRVKRTIPQTKLRNFILTGLALCGLALLTEALLNPDFSSLLLRAPTILALMIVVVVWNDAYAAVRWTHARTIEE